MDADISVVTRAQIEASGSASLLDVLGRLPGVQVTTTGDSPRVFLRGAEARMTALLVDGVRVDSQDGLRLGGGAPWELLPLDQIERIEVLRGPASAVYGSDAMGGVVHVVTRRGGAGNQAFASLSLGSQRTRGAAAGVSGAQGGLEYTLSLAARDSDGYDTRPDLTHTPQTEGSRQRSAQLRFGWELAPGQRLGAQALASALDSRYVPWNGGTDFQARSVLSSGQLTWNADWSPSYQTQMQWLSSRVARRDDVPYDYATQLQGWHVDQRWLLGAAQARLGLEFKRDRFDSQPSGYWDPAFAGERTQRGVSGGYELQSGMHHLSLQTRWDHDELFGDRTTGALRWHADVTPQWRTSLAWGSAFRAPTLEQVFGPYGSAALLPESNRTFEAAVRWQDSGRYASVVLARNDIQDMISSSASLTTCSAGYFCYFNVGHARVDSATLTVGHRDGANGVQATLDWLDPRDLATDHTLSLRARRSALLSADRTVGNWQLGVDWRAVGPRFDNAANTVSLAGYAKLDLRARVALSRDWQVLLRLDNALDATYQEVGGYAIPGRTASLQLQWQAR